MVLEKAGEIIAVEIKASAAPQVSKGFWNAAADIGAHKKYVIAPVEKAYPAQNQLTVTNVFQFIQNTAL